jgi:hypothetical protein
MIISLKNSATVFTTNLKNLFNCQRSFSSWLVSAWLMAVSAWLMVHGLPATMSHQPSANQLTGGGERDRTDDLLRARQALSQLSYTPSLWRIWDCELQIVFSIRNPNSAITT